MPNVPGADRETGRPTIAALSGAKLRAGDRRDRRIANIAPARHCGDIRHSAFFDNSKYTEALAATPRGACFVAPRFEAAAPAGPSCW